VDVDVVCIVDVVTDVEDIVVADVVVVIADTDAAGDVVIGVVVVGIVAVANFDVADVIDVAATVVVLLMHMMFVWTAVTANIAVAIAHNFVVGDCVVDAYVTIK